MVSIKSLLVATLVSSIVATPIESFDAPENDLEVVNKVPVIESRGNGGGYGDGGGASCDYNTKQRLDSEIQNRYQLKSRLDDEIQRRQGIKQQLDNQINQRQGQLGHC
ncbi:ec8 protein [Colletotrichum graminicola]|nr:ec8 protein [Colletotrichum graminicola]